MRKGITWGLVALLAALAGLVVLARIKRPAAVRAYFKLERSWNARWPFAAGKNLLEDLEPAMLKVGVIGPARVNVEPGITYYLDPRDLVPRTILRTREWQPEVWDSLGPVLSEGGVFLDVGAHIGYFSIKASRRVGKTGHVVSFEPNPETLKLLRDNVSANQAGNVTVAPVACTDREQTLTLYAASVANTGASSIAHENADISASEAPRAYTVRGRPIDDVVRELNLTRVDAMKIDVEGAEAFVLRGAQETLRRFHPRVVMEVVPAQLAKLGSTTNDLYAVLRAAGYERSRALSAQGTDREWVHPSRTASAIQMADPSTESQLIRGFHGLEAKAWRWTEGRFAVELKAPPAAMQRGVLLKLHFTAPGVSIQQLKTMTLNAQVGSLTLAPETYTTEGNHEYRREIPASALGDGVVEIRFSLDKFLGPPSREEELGVIVTAVELVSR